MVACRKEDIVTEEQIRALEEFTKTVDAFAESTRNTLFTIGAKLGEFERRIAKLEQKMKEREEVEAGHID
jgi:ribosome-interacting GTPase 1